MVTIPKHLGDVFTVADARAAGLSDERLRRVDVTAPFHGVRRRVGTPQHPLDGTDPYSLQANEHRARLLDLLPRLRPGQFVSHRTAAVAVWGAPMPLVMADGIAVHGAEIPVDLSIVGSGPLPRLAGVTAHRVRSRTTRVSQVDGIPVTTAASTWASLGTLTLPDLVALGDYLCRIWRPGVGRPDIGMTPLCSIQMLRAVIESGRRVGIRRLREAVELIREDSWSPRESKLRCILIDAGLPEPQLNIDLFDTWGRFLGCVDLAYPDAKIAIEYQSVLHSTRYAHDVERLAALRAAGWTVIEVTATLLQHPEILVSRVRAALFAAHHP